MYRYSVQRYMGMVYRDVQIYCTEMYRYSVKKCICIVYRDVWDLDPLCEKGN